MCMSLAQKIPTGCRFVDRFLGGGMPSASVALVYGEAETGKTTFVMQCAVNCARLGYKTLFVDCDGTFSTRRLCQIASNRDKEVAELIILMRPNDFKEQSLVIDNLSEYITKNFGMVIIDTITSLYRLRIAESPSKTFELNREMNRQLAVLAQIAKTQKVAVLVTSQVYSVLDEFPVSIEPVATRVLRFWADLVIAMKPTQTPQVIGVVLEKNPSMLPTATFELEILETGISDRNA